MKILIIKEHHFYAPGEADVDPARAKYLISIGAAIPATEKEEKPRAKEKREHKSTNVPTAKKR